MSGEDRRAAIPVAAMTDSRRYHFALQERLQHHHCFVDCGRTDELLRFSVNAYYYRDYIVDVVASKSGLSRSAVSDGVVKINHGLLRYLQASSKKKAIPVSYISQEFLAGMPITFRSPASIPNL
ncbi:MAG: hypothetical protein HQL42_05930 [Alphaproteobacteria bacterium]|nr:hypothetical protein [Alphaproteobacteria bacterium]